jgi:ribulose 1,5-bisphosphate carboxylase large subunit-like protein
VKALREAWEAAQAGVDLTAYAATRPALRSALGFW